MSPVLDGDSGKPAGVVIFLSPRSKPLRERRQLEIFMRLKRRAQRASRLRPCELQRYVASLQTAGRSSLSGMFSAPGAGSSPRKSGSLLQFMSLRSNPLRSVASFGFSCALSGGLSAQVGFASNASVASLQTARRRSSSKSFLHLKQAARRASRAR
jgi:hypothetical protein